MILNEKQINKLKNKKRSISKNELLQKYLFIKRLNIDLLKQLENNISLAWSVTTLIPHPLIFELGHVSLFYEHHILRHLRDKEGSILENSYEMFDSLINLPEMRQHSNIIPFHKQKEYFVKIMDELIYYINEMVDEVGPIHSYMFMVGYLHNIMHVEVYYFLFNLLRKPNPTSILLLSYKQTNEHQNYNLNDNLNEYTITNKWINIEGGSFMLGCKENERVVIWDNEMPQNEVIINNFECMEQPVSNGEYLEFVNDDGYTNKKYWSYNGWLWLQNTHKKTYPFLWDYRCDGENKWFRYIFDKIKTIKYNEPVVNISYYEAEAYANYRNARLPTEEEYVYLCTNGGTTLYPWGNNDENMEEYCNVNFSNNDVLSLDKYKNGANKWGINNLYGNCWYWTSTPFYPFDGFTIDALYDTFSYPFFYFRNIVKGCSWATNSDLIHSNYRNSQEKDKIFHFTGIRLVK